MPGNVSRPVHSHPKMKFQNFADSLSNNSLKNRSSLKKINKAKKKLKKSFLLQIINPGYNSPFATQFHGRIFYSQIHDPFFCNKLKIRQIKRIREK